MIIFLYSKVIMLYAAKKYIVNDTSAAKLYKVGLNFFFQNSVSKNLTIIMISYSLFRLVKECFYGENL